MCQTLSIECNGDTHLMIWISFGWSSGWGQVKSDQTRSNFEVGLFKQNWCLSDSVFDGEFNGGIFIFVDGLELPKIAIQNFDVHVFAVFWAISWLKIDGLPQNLAWA